MPAEAEVAQPEPKDIQLTQSLEHVFDQAFPASVEEEKSVEVPDLPKPQPRREPEPESAPEPEAKPVEKEKEKPTESAEPKSITDILFKDKESPVPTPKKTEVEPIKEEAPPEMKGKARENFDRLATAKFEAEKRAITHEKRVKELETKLAQGDPDAKARIQQLETERAQYSQLIERANLELHPRFQAEFVIPRQQLIEQAKTAAQDAGIDPQELETAMTLKGKAQADKLDELFEGIRSPTLRGKIERAVDNISNLDGRREATLKNQAVVLKQLQQQDQIQRHRQFEQQEQIVKAGLKTAQSFLQDRFKIFSPVDDPKFSDYNERLTSDIKGAEQIMLTVSDPSQMVIAAEMAARFPTLYELYVNEATEHKKTRQQLKEYRDSEPDLGGGGGRRGADLSAEEDEKLGLADAILKGLKGGK
jgi:hypothetical protein